MTLTEKGIDQYPKFLGNSPVGKDLFEGKSQENIADTLCNILQTTNFQIIGIDGSWGTGKSNLVHITETKLKEKNFYFFIYDVWGHQEDEQRKAILEELTEKIYEKQLISNRAKWKDKLKELTSKKRELTTTNTPYLSIGFIFSLFSIIYIPSVNAFKDSHFFGVEGVFLKVILVFLPIFIVVVIYLCHLIYCWIKKKGPWYSFVLASQKTFQVYTNKQEQETKLETITESEPSVKDFRKWMKDIDADLKNKKLVLVFDNFDRLPQKHILSLWSSIHVFFAEEKYKNIKVIIPFDRLHIKNAFKDLNAKSQNDNDHYKKKEDYSEDYINKTFDIVYRVSPPILSNWKNYFKSRWDEAFGNSDNQEYVRVEQLYEIFNEAITPREIIALINEIVSLKLLFGEKIPEQYFALFILNKDRILTNTIKEISDPEYLSGASYLYKNDENLAKYITAISYQIDPDNAVEVVYSKQLKNSLINKDFEKFNEISKTPLFITLIDSVLSEIDNIEYPIETLHTLDDKGSISKYKLDLIWNKLYDKAMQYGHNNFELRPYQKILLNHIEKDKASVWLSYVLKSLADHENFSAKTFSDIVDDIDIYSKENNISLDVLAHLQEKEVSTDLFIPLVDHKQEHFAQYKIKCDEVNLNDELINYTPDNFNETHFLKHLKQEYDLSKLQEELKAKILANKSNKTSLTILFKKLREIHSKPIESLLTDIEIYSLFTHCDESEDFYYDLIAMRFSYKDDFNSSYTQYFKSALDSTSDQYADKVAERIEFYINYDAFLLANEFFKDSELYKLVSQRIVINDYGESTGEIKSLLNNFEKICINTDVNPQQFLRDLDRWEYNIERVEFPNYLYEEAMKSESSIAGTLVSQELKYFENLDQEKWSQVFDKLDSKDFKRLQIINFKVWKSYSIEALKNSLLKMMISKKLSNVVQWEYLFDSFAKNNINLTNTFKDARDQFYGNGSLMTKEFFVFFIHYFLDYQVLGEKPGDAFRTIFKSEFLDDEETLKIIQENSETIKTMMDKCDKSNYSDFKQGIIDRKEQNEAIFDLANSIGI